MRRNLYKRVTNHLVGMDLPRMTVRDVYIAAGTLKKSAAVEEVKVGKIKVVFAEYSAKRIKVKSKIYKNQKAIGDIKSFLK